jgi:hypothetical protein
MPGQFGFALPCDGVVDEPPGVVALGAVVFGVVVLGVVAVPFELAAFAIAAPPPARIPALPSVRRAIRIRFMASHLLLPSGLAARKPDEHENGVWRT